MSSTSRSWLPIYTGPSVTRRRFLRSTGAGIAASIMLACGGGGGSSGLKVDESGNSRTPGTVWFAKNDWKLPDESKQAVRGGIYRGYMAADLPGHLDPIPQPNSAVPTEDHAYQMLMARNRGPGVDPSSPAYSTPIGSLAESWEVAPDATSYTFTLRQGVKFHNIPPVNGRVMDMDDWKSSYERQIAMGLYKTALSDAGLDKIEYPDARHMVFKFKVPFVPMVDRVWDSTFMYFILPRELNADGGKVAQERSIGTNYKILDKVQPSISVQYRKHPEYWGGNPFIERWHHPIIPEYANQYAQFVQGNITQFTPTAKDVFSLRKDAPGAVIVANPILPTSVARHKWGRLSPLSQAWKDERVRIAMRRSINYTGITEVLSNRADFEKNGIQVEISMMTHVMQNPSYWLNPEKGELGEGSKNYLFDIAEAKKLTAAAGFNEPVVLPYYISGTGALADAETLVVDGFTSAGVFKLDVHRVPENDYRTTINVDGKYDGTQSESGASGNDIDYVMFRDYHSSRVGGVAFPDPKMDQLAEAQRKEPDFQKRVAIIKEIQNYLAMKMFMNPGRSLYTTFSFRWPWLHNTSYSGETGIDGDVGKNPELGGYLQWLDANMPNRDKAI